MEMKFVVTGNLNGKSKMEHYFVEELRNQGHEVAAFDSRKILGIERGLNYEDLDNLFNGVIYGNKFITYYDTLISFVENNKPDYFFSMNDKLLMPIVIEVLQTRTKTIGFFGDNNMKLDYYQHYYPHFDIVLAPAYDPRYPKMKKWTWACALPYIKKLDVEKDIDVLWYGSLYPNRQRAIAYICDKLNPEFETPKYTIVFHSSFHGNEMWAEDLNKLINRAKVILHIDAEDVEAPTLRFYETLSTETILVSDTWYAPEINSWYQSPTKCKLSVDEMINEIKNKLVNGADKNDTTRWFNIKKYTMKRRVSEFLQILGENNG